MPPTILVGQSFSSAAWRCTPKTFSRMRARACSSPSRTFPAIPWARPARPSWEPSRLGTVTEAPTVDVQNLYLSRHENAKYWQDYTDFAYYRLEVSGVYFIGGF